MILGRMCLRQWPKPSAIYDRRRLSITQKLGFALQIHSRRVIEGEKLMNPLNVIGEFVGIFTHPIIFWGWVFTSFAVGSVWWVSRGSLTWAQIAVLLLVLAVIAIVIALLILASARAGTFALAYLLLASAVTSLAWSYHFSTVTTVNSWWSSAFLEVGVAMLLGSVLDLALIFARSNDRPSSHSTPIKTVPESDG